MTQHRAAILTRLLAALTALVPLMFAPARTIADAVPPFHELWRADRERGFDGWALAGVRVTDGRLIVDASAARDANGVPIDLPIGLPLSVSTVPLDSGGIAGLALSPVLEPSEPFSELIPSWNAETPAGTWIEVRARARVGERWTSWYTFGSWSTDDARGRRQSAGDQRDVNGRVATDTLRLQAPASAYQLLMSLHADDPSRSPALSLAATLASRPSEATREVASDGTAWGSVLDVPERSQMVYPNGGPVWCSPTSTSMVMAYWAGRLGAPSLDRPVPEVASAVYDPVYRGNGNWPFNTAYAAREGLSAYVSRMSSVVQLERWIAAGVPVVASLAWNPGDLPNASVPSTNGHLLVVVGFSETGQVVVNDPAADPRLGQSVRRTYPRTQFEALWLKHSGGTTYLIYPAGQAAPSEDAYGAW